MFAQLDDFVEILKIYPRKLVSDLKVLLEVLNCGRPIDAQLFGEFTSQWLDEFDQNPEIRWNQLTPSVHLLMHHGESIINLFPVPPGKMSEEGSEAVVQTFRYVRAHNARQMPNENLGDTYKRQWLMCNPKILSLFKSPKRPKMKTPLSPEAEALLAPPETYDLLPEESDTEDEDEEVCSNDSNDSNDSDSNDSSVSDMETD